MGKRNNLTKSLKNDRRKRRKQVEEKKKVEQRKKHIAAITPLEKTHFLCDHQGSVYRFFKKEDEEYADAFSQGQLYISTLGNCRAYEDDEQGDKKEAYETYSNHNLVGNGSDTDFVEKAQRSNIGISHGSMFTTINATRTRYIPDAYVLCTSTDFSPENMSEAIGNGHCVEIRNPRKFFNIVSRKINSISAIRDAGMGKVKYTDRSYAGLDQQPGPIGFVKPKFPYEKQKEFRFLWIMENMDKLEPILIDCPEVRKLCKRIA